MKAGKSYIVLAAFILVSLGGCQSNPKVVYDPNTIGNMESFETDKEECIVVAKSYDLDGEKAGKVVAGAAIGGTAVAGVATAVAGAIFWPAIPFIVAAAAVGGGAWGGSVSKKEAKARESILYQCLNKRGYDVYSPA